MKQRFFYDEIKRINVRNQNHFRKKIDGSGIFYIGRKFDPNIDLGETGNKAFFEDFVHGRIFCILKTTKSFEICLNYEYWEWDEGEKTLKAQFVSDPVSFQGVFHRAMLKNKNNEFITFDKVHTGDIAFVPGATVRFSYTFKMLWPFDCPSFDHCWSTLITEEKAK